MRTYHALYKPKKRANPRRRRTTTRRNAVANPHVAIPGLRRALRQNPVSSADAATVISERVTEDLESQFKGKSGFFKTRALGPAGTILIEPGQTVEYRTTVWEGDPKQWSWVNFDNLGNAFDQGKEKTPKAAMKEAAGSLTQWSSPVIARLLELSTRGKKGGAAADKATRASIGSFRFATFTGDGSKLPGVGKSVTRKGAGRKTVRIFGEKPKKSWKGAGDVVFYIQILDDDGNPIGGVVGDADSGKIGPLPDGPTIDAEISKLMGIFQGEDDMVEANPVQRQRLRSQTRRFFAEPNGFADVVGASVPVEVSKSQVSAGELESFDDIVGIPVGDPKAAWRVGYYYGMLRGINSCKWYPSPTGIWERRKFRKEFERKIIAAYNALARDAMSKTAPVKTIATPGRRGR
jgi:hypothetical protein